MTDSSAPSSGRKLLLVQFAGDFREAERVLLETGQETYYNHRHILDTLASTQQIADTTIMCCRTAQTYDTHLRSGVRTIAVGVDPSKDSQAVIDAISAVDPTDVIFLGPMADVIDHCLDAGMRVSCLWADSFPTGVWRTYLARRRLKRQLNDPRVAWVGDHGRNACRSLVKIGVDPAKVFAWDYLHDEDPEEYPARDLAPGSPPRLFFAGLLAESKGAFDLVEAIALLREQGIDAQVRMAGAGDDARLARQVEALGLTDAVTPLGLLPNAEVLTEMRRASAVVVPSRHTYPEGQPLTVNEALRARTPIVASDHFMFEGTLVEGRSAVVFAAGKPKALARAVRRLHANPSLYRQLSDQAPATWRHLAVDVKWGDVVLRWARDNTEDRAWFAALPGEFAQ